MRQAVVRHMQSFGMPLESALTCKGIRLRAGVQAITRLSSMTLTRSHEWNMPRSYEDLPGLRNVYLEDSFVLDVEVGKSDVSFRLEAVLRENHPDYERPKTGEQYCYRLGVLRFPGLREVQWIRRTMRSSTDASGSTDLGNIDELVEESPGHFRISGDWGEMTVDSQSPVLSLVAA